MNYGAGDGTLLAKCCTENLESTTKYMTLFDNHKLWVLLLSLQSLSLQYLFPLSDFPDWPWRWTHPTFEHITGAAVT